MASPLFGKRRGARNQQSPYERAAAMQGGQARLCMELANVELLVA
jgi:hypothetical protein